MPSHPVQRAFLAAASLTLASSTSWYSSRSSAQDLNSAVAVSSNVTFVSIPIKTPTPDPTIIVIDPGHGGKDHGMAICPQSQCEKDINLKVSQIIYDRLAEEADIRPVLTRQDDRFVPLNDRVKVAFQAQAHLVVSIHANYNRDSSLRGIETYTRETVREYGVEDKVIRGRFEIADSWLMNSALPAPDLIQWSQKNAPQALRASYKFQSQFVKRLDPKTLARKAEWRQDLVVLRSPNIPSILVELGYMSNAGDRATLTSAEGQRQRGLMIAEAILNEVRSEQFQADVAVLPQWPQRHVMQIASAQYP